MNKLKTLKIEKLYGTIDVDLTFNEGLNVIHGKNGTGKTTIANTIANIMRFDFNKLSYLNSKKIEFEFFNGDNYIIKIKECPDPSHHRDHIHFDLDLNYNGKNINIKNQENLCSNQDLKSLHKAINRSINPANSINQFESIWYWPANRIIDEVNQLPRINSYLEQRGRESDLHLELFPKFTAKSSYLTIAKISEIFKNDRLSHLEKKNDLVQETIKNLREKRESDCTLEEFAQSFDDEANKIDELEREFEYKRNSFVDRANEFLIDKTIEIERSNKSKTIVLYDSNRNEIATDENISKILSSGERQFIPMLYQAIKLDQEALIVDEPEVSLDINWQEVLGDIFSKKESAQVICFTHSYSFSESFKWEEETFFLIKDKNVISNKRPSEVGLHE